MFSKISNATFWNHTSTRKSPKSFNLSKNGIIKVILAESHIYPAKMTLFYEISDGLSKNTKNWQILAEFL